MRKFLVLAGAAALWAAATLGQPMSAVPRWNSNPPMATTTAAPTANPAPEFAAGSQGCYGGNTGSFFACTGQSQVAALIGALHLNGCSKYSITLCGDGGTLSGAGTVQVYGWPEFPVDAGGQNLWSRAPQLDETVTVAATTQCQHFAGHTADGFGWIYAAPNAVTVSAGVVSVRVEAACGN